MRTFLIIFLTLILIGGGFAVYVSMQKPTAKRPSKSLATAARPVRAASTTQSVHGIGSVDNPWVKRFENGELTSQFRSERSEPKGGDVVLVTRPQAEFFTGDGAQRLRVEGASGEVIVPGGGGGGGGGGGNQSSGNARTPSAGGGANMSPPSRGRLEDVEISMYEPADAAEPTLVATMPNAVFDNDTFRISTEAYTDGSGQRVEADQVPVVVRGRDYDFSGRGLVIRWNQLDRKLQLLEVAHGESLTVKNLDALSKTKLTNARPAHAPGTLPTARAAMAAMLASTDPRAIVLAAADPPAEPTTPPMTPGQARRLAARRAAATAATRPKLTRDLAPVVYRASFDNDVNIFEGEKRVATADRLEIDILQAPHEDPATKPATAGSTDASTRPAKRRRADATSAPASIPAVQGPVTVKWTGKLRVVPLESERDPALVPGKPIVRLTGAPVEIAHEDMVAKSAVVAFNAADGSASLRANDIVPIVTMTLGDAKVTTPSLTYVQQPDGKQVATLVGPSSAVMTSKGAKDPLTLTWNKDGRIELVELPNGKSTIERADFSGAVKIVHPDLDMTGETLALGFDTSRAMKNAAAQPVAGAATLPAAGSNDDVADSLREIIATGDVNCRMTDGTEQRTIAGQELAVQLELSPAGERFARFIRATGGVRTKQGSDEMQAGRLVAELAPASPAATQPVATVDASDAKPAANPFGSGKAQLVSLVARDAVKLATADGSSAAADTLEVVSVNGKPQYRLSGTPAATVTQGKTVISGPAIRFAPDEQIAEVIGAGGMKGTLPDDPKESFNVAWAGGAVVNGAKNLIDVTKQVVIQSIQQDGTINTATSSRLQAKLEPKSTTQPITATATTTATTKKSQSDEMNFLAGKEVTSATLLADAGQRVEIKSELFAPDGALLRGLNLWATTVTTNRATGRLEIPVPGEMIVRDHRPPEEKKADAGGGAAQPKQQQEGPTLGSGRGNTAFRWHEWLVYDDALKQAVMKGNVEVVHHPITKEGQPFNLWADELTAHLEPDPAAAAAAAAEAKPHQQDAAPAKAPDKQPRMRVKRVTAVGHVKIESVRLDVEARELSYDPVAQVLHARGTPEKPITVIDKEKGTTTTAGELEWNTATDQFRIKELGGKVQP